MCCNLKSRSTERDKRQRLSENCQQANRLIQKITINLCESFLKEINPSNHCHSRLTTIPWCLLTLSLFWYPYIFLTPIIGYIPISGTEAFVRSPKPLIVIRSHKALIPYFGVCRFRSGEYLDMYFFYCFYCRLKTKMLSAKEFGPYFFWWRLLSVFAASFWQ